MGEDTVVMTGAWPRDKLPTPLRFFPSVPSHWSVPAPHRGPLLTWNLPKRSLDRRSRTAIRFPRPRGLVCFLWKNRLVDSVVDITVLLWRVGLKGRVWVGAPDLGFLPPNSRCESVDAVSPSRGNRYIELAVRNNSTYSQLIFAWRVTHHCRTSEAVAGFLAPGFSLNFIT